MTAPPAAFTDGERYRKDWRFVLSAWLLYLIIRALSATLRYRVFGAENRIAAEAHHPCGGFVIASWHENILANMTAHKGQPFCPMVSPSRDGEFVTWIGERLGYQAVRGSTSRRGLDALQEIDIVLNKGNFSALAVDGPKGARLIAKLGVIDIARRSGVAILPLATVAEKYFVFAKSWDRFRVPKPFSRVVVRYGTPITVPPDTSGIAFGQMKKRVGQTLLGLEDQVLKDFISWSAR